MAFLPSNNFNQDDEEDKTKPQLSSSENVISSGGGAGTSGAPTQAQGGGAKSPGTGFVNLQRYLDYNKPKAQSMAQGVSDKIGSDYQAGSGAIQTLGTQASAASAAALPQQTQDFGGLIRSGQSDKIDRNSFDAVYRGDYKAPQLQDLGGFEGAQDTIRRSNETLNAAGTNAGRKTLMADVFKAPNYSRGESSLDGAIVTADPTARQTIKDKVTATRGGLEKQLEAVGSNLKKANETNLKTAQDRVDPIRAAILQRLGNVDTGLNKQLTQTNAARDRAVAGALLDAKRLSDTDILKELTAKGIKLPDGPLENLSPNFLRDTYVKSLIDGGDIQLGDIVTDAQRAEVARLQDLYGQDLGFKYAGASGVDLANPYSFNKQAFEEAVRAEAARVSAERIANAKMVNKPDIGGAIEKAFEKVTGLEAAQNAPTTIARESTQPMRSPFEQIVDAAKGVSVKNIGKRLKF
jgi:hypothetical protein